MSRSPELTDTIAAVATGRGAGALGTVRLSGPRALSLARRLFHPWKDTDLAGAGRVALSGTALVPDGVSDSPIDQGVLVFFPAASSPTGEDLVEITLHGSPLVLNLFVEGAVAAGARPALPGEFSYRALVNGKLDAVQAEAVDDLIRARTAHQARLAHQQQTGALSRAVEDPRRLLVEWLARLEGSIEFSATEPEDFLDRDRLVAGLEEMTGRLQQILAGAGRGIAIRDGIRIVLAGPVNAGKSSLFNALLEFDRAIVSPHPGTTRDFIEAAVEWEGLPVTLVDTAGERGDATDPVELAGQERGAGAREAADLVLWVVDGSAAEAPVPGSRPAGPPSDGGNGEPPCLPVINKIDLGLPATASPGVAVSAKTGAGLEALKEAVMAAVVPEASAEAPLVTRLRQQRCLTLTLAEMRQACRLAAAGEGEEIIVLPLARALERLAELTGRGDLEEVYDRIFSKFCIGK